MNHQIKINKAAKLAPKLPMATREIWDSIPVELIERLTSRDLAVVVNMLNRHWHKAARHNSNEIIAEGYVWSDRHQALLDIKYPAQER